MSVCARDPVKNGVVCPGADAEPAALHPHRLLTGVPEMRAADPGPRRRLQQPGNGNFTRSDESKTEGKNRKILLFGVFICFILAFWG